MLYSNISKRRLTSTILILLFVFITAIKSGSACTIFTASYGNTVLFGNSEDWLNPNTYIWFKLSRTNSYGRVYLGFDDYWPQGGMNEKGLCFDANGLPEVSLNPHPELPYCGDWVVKYCLEKCANVTEVIDTVKKFNWGTSMAYQTHFADATGDAVVISAGTNGELNFTRKTEGDGYLVSTNFNLVNSDNGWFPCPRYNTATEMLDAVNHEDNLTIDSFRNILDAVHQEGTYATRYSNIFDLKNRDIYIYQNFNFNKVVVLNLDEKLSEGDETPISINDLFIQETKQTSTTETTSEMSLLFVCLSIIWLSILRKRK